LPLLLLLLLLWCWCVVLQVCNQHGKQVQWNNCGILKAVVEGSPLDKLAAVATVQVRTHGNSGGVKAHSFACDVCCGAVCRYVALQARMLLCVQAPLFDMCVGGLTPGQAGSSGYSAGTFV
jgi:hypothetical protein